MCTKVAANATQLTNCILLRADSRNRAAVSSLAALTETYN